jgi:uncharacterized membrane protein YccC
MAKEGMSKLGAWAFIVGLILAIVIALISGTQPPAWGLVTLAVLGIVVGLLNITEKEVQMFLIATIGFLIGLQVLGNVIDQLFLGWKAVSIFLYLIGVFIAPAAVIVSIKALFSIAQD